MAVYDDFVDRAETRWLPYLMYFHRADYRSAVVNTDELGFRHTHALEGVVSPCAPARPPEANLLIGSSTAFGVGATTDAGTMASRLSLAGAPSAPWLNLGARGYTSTQELLLYMLHRQRFDTVRNMVIFSGINNLALAGLPASMQREYGAFFFSGEYYRQMDALREEHRRSREPRWRRKRPVEPDTTPEPVPSLDERIAYAVDRVSADLRHWRVFASDSSARLCYVLQPLATWVRAVPEQREQRLFTELDASASNFWRLFGAIAPVAAGRAYAEALAEMCRKLDIDFLDMNPVLADAADPDAWLFVDRAHFTDEGYDLVSTLLAKHLDLS